MYKPDYLMSNQDEIRKCCRVFFLFDGILNDQSIKLIPNNDAKYLGKKLAELKKMISGIIPHIEEISERYGEDPSPCGEIYDRGYLENGVAL